LDASVAYFSANANNLAYNSDYFIKTSYALASYNASLLAASWMNLIDLATLLHGVQCDPNGAHPQGGFISSLTQVGHASF
jgi:hypothetical protein